MIVSYGSFDEILRDRRLDFVTDDQTPAGVLLAVEERMKAMGDQQGTEQYRLLAEARTWLDEHDGDSLAPSTALVPMPAQTLEKIVDALSERSSQSSAGRKESPEARLISHSSAAVRKASEDFRRARTYPLTGLGTLATAVIATRSTLNVEDSTLESAYWYAGAASVILLAVLILVRSRQSQERDEEILRRLYDPDIHGVALTRLMREADEMGGIPDELRYTFSRTDFRAALWSEASESRLPPRSRPFSTVDIPGAVVDATELALERLLAMKVLAVGTRAGVERFQPGEAP